MFGKQTKLWRKKYEVAKTYSLNSGLYLFLVVRNVVCTNLKVLVIIWSTCMDGFCKWPKFDVVCLGSWPKTIMFGLINRNASITTWKCLQTEHNSFFYLLDNHTTEGDKIESWNNGTYLSFYTLYWINNNRNSSIWQCFKTLKDYIKLLLHLVFSCTKNQSLVI